MQVQPSNIMATAYKATYVAPPAYDLPAKATRRGLDQRDRANKPARPPTTVRNRENNTSLALLSPFVWRKMAFGKRTAATPLAPQKMARPNAATAAYSPACSCEK